MVNGECGVCVLTYTRHTVSSGQQTVRAVAFVAAWYISAFTSVADSWVLLALVYIHARSTVQIQSVASAVTNN